MIAAAPLLSVILPVRDEGLNLRVMLRVLRGTVDIAAEVIVVHDDAEDDAAGIEGEVGPGRIRVRAVRNDLGPGIPNAVRAGVAVAEGKYVLLFAADEVGPVLAIEDMLTLMAAGCDLVSCTRYALGGRRLGGSFVGGLLSRIANRAYHVVAGSAFTDATTGIKMFRRELLSRLDLKAHPVGWAFVFELAIKAELAGLRLGEVPIVSIDRLYGGTSSFRIGSWVKEYLRWFLWGAIRLRRVPRAPAMHVPASASSRA